MRKIFIPAIFLFFCSLASGQANLNGVTTWAYQLQNININTIAANNTFQLIVTDYSHDGTDAMKLSPAEVATVKNSGKKMISYVSIGEAENYRSYWQSSWNTTSPAWLGAENPNWPGNFKVKYWDTAWQSIVFSYIDTVVAQGFDGIYLDIIDGWYYWQTTVPQGQQVSNADSLMIDFVLRIRAHVNAVTGNSNFILMPQNGEDLLFQSNIMPAQTNQYYAAINAVGIEDVFFNGANSMDNNYAPDTYRLNNLAQYQAHGKKVFNIEYLSQPAKIQQYKDTVQQYAFVPYICDRALDQLCNGIILGMKEESKNDFVLFPNPVTNDQIQITSGDLIKGNTSFFIEDAQGRKTAVPPSWVGQGENHFNIKMPSAIANGLYLLIVQNANAISVSRFVLQR